MKKRNIVEIVVKVIVAALTALLDSHHDYLMPRDTDPILLLNNWGSLY